MLRSVGYNLLSFAVGLNFLLYSGSAAPSFAQSASNGVRLIQVPFSADKVRSLPDNSVVLVSERDRRIERRNSQGKEVWDIHVNHSIADISISKAGDFISFVGTLDEKDASGAIIGQKTVVSQVNVNTGDVSQVDLSIVPGKPTITSGDRQDIYLGSSESEKINSLDRQLFKAQFGSHLPSVAPKVLATNHELGGVSDLTTTQSGQFLFVSSLKPRGVSAYDLKLGKWIGYLSIPNLKLPGSVLYPLRLSASDATPETSGSENAKASIVVADFGPVSRLLVAELDEAFGAFTVIQSVDLNFAAPSQVGTGADNLPILLSSDIRQQTIVVGSRFSRDISVYSRNGRAIELRGSRTLAAAPVDISVSADGTAIDTLVSGGTYVDISDPHSAAYAIAPSSPCSRKS